MADELSREERLASMARRFVDRARDQAVRIAELRPQVNHEHGKGEALLELRQLVHSLHGSAGTFGYGEVSIGAGEAEDLCDGLMAGGDSSVPSLFGDLDHAIEKLLALIKQLDAPPTK
ncbi:MAG TPA: Hpt domain-containing protein [Magnetospirillaceae bacterium]|jgi:HPt (histidine-containing phosphotransfer) domain-containing protein